MKKGTKLHSVTFPDYDFTRGVRGKYASHYADKSMADQWDRQIERDVVVGRLDHIIRKVDREIDAGCSTSI